MGAVQLSHIKAYISNNFRNLIDLSDARSDSEREALLLTRGLAAMALQLLSGISFDTAAASITDGFNDGGIDAIYHDITKKEVLFVQSKWSDDGGKTISQGDNLKFINGLKSIIRPDFSQFNDKIKSRETDITSFLYEANYTVKIIIAHVSNDSISTHCINDINSFLDEMNDTSDLFSFEEINQRKLHRFVRDEGEQSIDIEIDLYDFGISSGSRKVFYGKISAAAIAEWKEGNATALFDKNIRTFLGDTTINSSIIESLRKNQEDFIVLNNGITIICDKINDSLAGAGLRTHKRLICNGVQIVNGAQTVGACHKARYKDNTDISTAFVMSKIIEVGDDDSLADLITRATNTQNKIERKDFVSLDDVQKNLRISFSLFGVDYLIKSGETSKSKADSLTLEEATHALIAQKQDIDLASLAKREIGKIWEKLDGKNYTSLFNTSVDATRLWKLVKIFRKIESEVANAATFYDGRGKGYAVHGNIFLAMQIYKRLNLNDYFANNCDEAQLSEHIQKQSAIVFAAVYFVGEKDYGGSYLAHLFRNATKCRDIASKLDAPINKLLPHADIFTMELADKELNI